MYNAGDEVRFSSNTEWYAAMPKFVMVVMAPRVTIGGKEYVQVRTAKGAIWNVVPDAITRKIRRKK